MTSNTVADCAKAREVDEKTLLKNGGERIVEIGCLCESPQFLCDLGSLRGEAEEVGKNTESPADASALRPFCIIPPPRVPLPGTSHKVRY